MKRFIVIITLLAVALFGCTRSCPTQISNADKVKEYSATAVSLSDFSMTIKGYYESQNLSIPKDFDPKQFFDVLEKKYPDQSRVKHIKENYVVMARPLDGGYSVMLCDPQTNRKIMEDLSCHISYVEIRTWETNAESQCVFESNWKPYCE